MRVVALIFGIILVGGLWALAVWLNKKERRYV